MEFRELEEKLEEHLLDMLRSRSLERTSTSAVLYQLGKATEELGELASEVLTSLGLASSKKRRAFKKDRLQDELGDTIVALFMLGSLLNIDLQKTMQEALVRHLLRADNSRNCVN